MKLNTIQNKRPERALARDAGRPTYFTGRQCKNGHISERNTNDASCVQCRVEDAQRPEVKERKRLHAVQVRASGTEEEKQAHRDKWAADQRRLRAEDPEKFRARERKNGRLKRQRHPQRKLAEVRARQAAKQMRTPPWADLGAIRDFYENCPPGYEVDHVVPLRGKFVSGLHVVGNLQYLTKEANRLKGNRFTLEAIG